MAGFRNILVLSGVGSTSTACIEKAIELGDPDQTRIHLLRILPELSATERIRHFFAGDADHTREHKEELQQLSTRIQDQYKSLQTISNILVYRHPGSAIRRYLHQNKIDLIIENIGDTADTTQLPDALIMHSGIPLLALRQELSRPSAKSLLLPVSGMVSLKKIHASMEIAQKTGAQVHIVTVLNNSKTPVKQQAEAFYQTYKLFCEYGHYPQYRVLTGRNKPEMVMHYASQVKAGMLLLNTHPVNWMHSVKRWLHDQMHPGKAFQVLTMRLQEPSMAQ
jgi:hypothetical protein